MRFFKEVHVRTNIDSETGTEWGGRVGAYFPTFRGPAFGSKPVGENDSMSALAGVGLLVQLRIDV